jgi:hypothetical protein
MRYATTFIFTCLSALSLTSSLNAEPWFEEPAPNNFYFGGGYRRDDFKFGFQGLNGTPDVLCDFYWRELQSCQINMAFDHTTWNQWYWRVNGMYGNILSGHNHHNEYGEDGKEDKYSNTHSNADRGQVWDLSGGFGHLWVSDAGRFSFAPLAGYSFHQQRYQILGGDQEYNPLEGILGRIPDLRGRNVADWSSPWLGVDGVVRLQSNVTLRAGAEWHFVRYQGTGYWKMDDTFDVHWRTKAFGYGALGFFGFDCDICEGFSVGLWGNYRHFYTKQGHYRATVKLDTVPGQIFGTIPTETKVSMNRVTWNSYSISCCTTYRF